MHGIYTKNDLLTHTTRAVFLIVNRMHTFIRDSSFNSSTSRTSAVYTLNKLYLMRQSFISTQNNEFISTVTIQTGGERGVP